MLGMPALRAAPTSFALSPTIHAVRAPSRRIASWSGAGSGLRTGSESPPITTDTNGRHPSASTIRSVGASGLLVTIATPSPHACA